MSTYGTLNADLIGNSNGQTGNGIGPGFKNRIINGAMVIDQRNAGATVTTTNSYPVDRFQQQWSGVGVLTSKQSTDAPEGFTNSLEVKVTTVDSSIGSTDFYQITQVIEGFNVADIGLGQSWCKPISLSFWVKASQTGTYSVQLANNTGNRCYPTTITVNSANTWEYKTISIPATTSGTFLTNNSIGLGLRIGFAYGSDFDGATPNTWGTFTTFGDSFVAPTTNMMATLNATFYITGVQLEVGSSATSFDYRPYGTELSLCQRYYCKTFNTATAPAQNAGSVGAIAFISQANQLWDAMWRFPVEMRATPGTVTTYSTNQTNANWSLNGDSPTASTNSVGAAGLVIRATTPAAGGRAYNIHASASAEL